MKKRVFHFFGALCLLTLVFGMVFSCSHPDSKGEEKSVRDTLSGLSDQEKIKYLEKATNDINEVKKFLEDTELVEQGKGNDLEKGKAYIEKDKDGKEPESYTKLKDALKTAKTKQEELNKSQKDFEKQVAFGEAVETLRGLYAEVKKLVKTSEGSTTGGETPSVDEGIKTVDFKNLSEESPIMKSLAELKTGGVKAKIEDAEDTVDGCKVKVEFDLKNVAGDNIVANEKVIVTVTITPDTGKKLAADFKVVNSPYEIEKKESESSPEKYVGSCTFVAKEE